MIDCRDLKKWLSKPKKLCQSRLLLKQYTLQFSLERYKSIMYYACNTTHAFTSLSEFVVSDFCS